MRLAIYAGTFDPVTFGHLDVIDRALRIFDELEITVAINATKETLFTLDERCELVRACTKQIDHVKVSVFEGLLVDYAASKGACALVRGLRQISDFDYEMGMAFANRRLNSRIETVLFPTAEENAFVSGALVREIHQFGGDVTSFVPPVVIDALDERRSHPQ